MPKGTTAPGNTFAPAGSAQQWVDETGNLPIARQSKKKDGQKPNQRANEQLHHELQWAGPRGGAAPISLSLIGYGPATVEPSSLPDRDSDGLSPVTPVTNWGELGHCPLPLQKRRLSILRAWMMIPACLRRCSVSFANGLKTIVVATDLHGQSEAALEYARKLATNYGARIVLAHGLDPMEYADIDGVPVRVQTGLSEEARAGSRPVGRRSAARGNSQPLGDSSGRGCANACGCGPPVRGRADPAGHQGYGRGRPRGCGCNRRAAGASVAVPGDGGSRGLECRQVPSHPRRPCHAGDGAQRSRRRQSPLRIRWPRPSSARC